LRSRPGGDSSRQGGPVLEAPLGQQAQIDHFDGVSGFGEAVALLVQGRERGFEVCFRAQRHFQ
jgi:hypothetical protein